MIKNLSSYNTFHLQRHTRYYSYRYRKKSCVDSNHKPSGRSMDIVILLQKWQSQAQRTKWWREQGFTGSQYQGSNGAGTIVPTKPLDQL